MNDVELAALTSLFNAELEDRKIINDIFRFRGQEPHHYSPFTRLGSLIERELVQRGKIDRNLNEETK